MEVKSVIRQKVLLAEQDSENRKKFASQIQKTELSSGNCAPKNGVHRAGKKKGIERKKRPAYSASGKSPSTQEAGG